MSGGQVETASVFFSCFSLPLPLQPLGIKQLAGLLSLKVKADLFDMWPFKMSDKYLFSKSLLNNSLMLLHNCCTTLQLFSFRFLGSAQPLLLIINKVLSIVTTAGAHRLSGVRSQQATVRGKKAVGQSSGTNFSTNLPTFRPKSRVLGRHSGSA